MSDYSKSPNYGLCQLPPSKAADSIYSVKLVCNIGRRFPGGRNRPRGLSLVDDDGDDDEISLSFFLLTIAKYSGTFITENFNVCWG